MTTKDTIAAALLNYFRSPEYIESAKKFAGEWLGAPWSERDILASEDRERLARELAERIAAIPGLTIVQPGECFDPGHHE